MDDPTFRAWAHRLADWMADYRENVSQRRILPTAGPGDIAAQLPPEPPPLGTGMEEIMADFERIVLPGMMHWNHPGWFGYFPANNSGPSILAEMLTATIGAQCMSWQTSPAATELEQVTLDWLRRMLDLPEGFRGVIHDTASSATLVAVLMARERATKGRSRREGPTAPGSDRLRLYTSREAHASVEKAVFLAGLGADNLRRIDVDADRAMDPEALEAAIRSDLAAGCLPAAVLATVGTTSSTALDPLSAIGAVCSRHGAFLHVDAAYAGTAAVLPEKRHILDGVEHADSFVFNPHKWMFVNFDCSAHFVKDVDLLLETCAMDPEYLKTRHDDDVANFRDWGIPLGRRFRALKLWFVIRSFGVEGIRARIRQHIELAAELAERISEHEDFELLAPVPLGLVCFRFRKRGLSDSELDEINQRLLEAVNASGKCFLTHTMLEGRFTIRLVVGQEKTTPENVDEVWRHLQEQARQLT
jgi:aromatic-L-amino-acid decarboxylase